MSDSETILADSTLRRYLLGELGEAERDALEERLFLDDAAFARLESIENDLLDEIARDELAAPAFAAAHRDRLVVARALAESADRRANGRRSPGSRWRPFLLVAAAALVTAVGLWIGVLERTRATIDLTVARGEAGPPVVKLGRWARTLELRLELPPEVAPIGLDATLVGVGGAPAWSGPVAPGEAAIAVPVAELAPGLYELELWARSPEGAELVAARQVLFAR